MQVTETLSQGLKHEFQISVPASDLDAKADARLIDLKDKVRLNGFRPGKVPVSHLKKVYGRSVMAETTAEVVAHVISPPPAASRPGMDAFHAGVAELVDALDLGSSDESCGGSSPSARTKRSIQAFA